MVKNNIFFYARIVENNIKIQKEDYDKQIEALKEENKRLREHNVSFQQQIEEESQVNRDLQEQVLQLTKHVKVSLVLPLFFFRCLQNNISFYLGIIFHIRNSSWLVSMWYVILID